MYYNIHTHCSDQLPNVVSIVNHFPSDFSDGKSFFSVGIHPWYIDQNNLAEDFLGIEKQMQDANCVAIGECGLDKKQATDIIIQQAIFEKQLHIANQVKKPVIVHCVAAFDELIAIKTQINPDVQLVIHGFSKNKQVAEQLIKAGFYLSFGKAIFSNPKVIEALQIVPNNRLFLETDTSAYTINEVYEKVAEIKQITIEDLKQIIEFNFKNVFTHGRMDGESRTFI